MTENTFLVSSIEEAMVAKFPYEIPADVARGPVLKGRATLEMTVATRDNPSLPRIVFEITVDGYNAPVTAGNFVDLVQRKFYDGMEIQRGEIGGFATLAQHQFASSLLLSTVTRYAEVDYHKSRIPESVTTGP